jgi:hypothetical protein
MHNPIIFGAHRRLGRACEEVGEGFSYCIFKRCRNHDDLRSKFAHHCGIHLLLQSMLLIMIHRQLRKLTINHVVLQRYQVGMRCILYLHGIDQGCYLVVQKFEFQFLHYQCYFVYLGKLFECYNLTTITIFCKPYL